MASRFADLAPPRSAYALGGAKLLVHLLTNQAYGFHRDELYFIVCGSRLAWGYVDQGPLVPALAALSRAIGGESLGALRFLPALAGALTVFAVSWLTTLLGGGRFAAAIASLAVLVAPAYLRMHTMLHIPTFESMHWALGCVLLAIVLKQRDARFFLILGAVIGVGFLNKPTMVLFGGGLVAGLVFNREARSYLRSPYLWAGGVLAVLIGAPFVLWQIENGWPSAGFMSNLAMTTRQIPRWAFLLGQIVYLHPVTLPVWIGGLALLLRAQSMRLYRPLAWIWIVPFLVFLSTGAKIYYLAAAYPPLFAAGGVWLERKLTSAAARRTALTVLVLSGLLLTPAGLPIVPLERYPDFVRTLTGGRSRVEELHEVINDYYDMTGWPELAATVREVYESVERDELESPVGIFTANYGEASALTVFAPELPPARSGDLSFHHWGAGHIETRAEILVGLEPREAYNLCREVTLAARFQNLHNGAPEDDVPIVVCRPRQPLSEVWSSLRHGF
jgi:hypothetical protein